MFLVFHTKIFHVMSPWGPFQCMFLYFYRTISYFLMKFCICRCLWHYSDSYDTKMFYSHHLLLCWGPFWGIFRPIVLVYVPPILENCSVFSYEVLYRCFLYNSDSHYTKNVFHIISLSAGDHFGVFWGPIWDIFGVILKTLS